MDNTENDSKAAGAQSLLTAGLGMIRPVRCYFCAGKMFYSGDMHHAPEVRVAVDTGGEEGSAVFYAHLSCWAKRMIVDA